MHAHVLTLAFTSFTYADAPNKRLRELHVLLLQLLSVIPPNRTCITHMQRACSSPMGWTELLDPKTTSPLQRLYNLRVLIFVLSGEHKDESAAEIREKFHGSGGLEVVSRLLEEILNEASKPKVSVETSLM